MTLPSEGDVQQRADFYGRAWHRQMDGTGGSLFPPPPHFLVFLAHMLGSAKVEHVFWTPGETVDHETSSGRVVVVTGEAIFDVTFKNAPLEYYPGQPAGPLGETATLVFKKEEVRRVDWRSPRLIRPSGSLQAGEIVVTAPALDWTLELPPVRMHHGETYAAAVLTAFGLLPGEPEAESGGRPGRRRVVVPD